MTALCAALLFAFITQEAGGATLFLSTSGHDTNNDGSEGYPFVSLTKALSASVAGDTVVVKAGIYDGALNKGLSVNHDLILRAADVPTSNDKVIFDGGDAGGSILTVGAAANVSLSHIIFRRGSGSSIGGGALAITGSAAVTIKYCTVSLTPLSSAVKQKTCKF